MNHLERTFGRQYRHGMWRTVYQEKAKVESVWMSVFVLGMALIGLVLVGIPLVAIYGK